jgi:hypothetical protein
MRDRRRKLLGRGARRRDAYTLKSIIHDYEDERAVAILRICRRAMAVDATLLLIERIVGSPNEDPTTKFSDLNMLVAPAGRERTLHEWEALVTRAGFGLATATPSTSGLAVIEAAPATLD